jgi:diguanylate cyclase (GGDEF)-like protein/PAS domain S-box-containing protein
MLDVIETPAAPSLERCSALSCELLAVVDADGFVAAANPVWSSLLGWSREALIAHPFLDLFHPQERTATAQAIAIPVDRRTVFAGRVRTHAGAYRWVEWTAVRDAAGHLHAAGRDVTGEREARATAAELARLALVDGLTGLLNHRAFHVRLVEEVERARRYEAPLCLALVDFDHFKAINDAHGHQAGDAVLSRGARLLRDTARTTDPLGRVGGEEFAWLLPETTLGPATVACDRARNAIAAPGWSGGAGTTVSIGVVELRAGESRAELYRRADGALYAAKADGRNRVVAQ